MKPAGRLLLGTSGFGYDAWKGRFYRKDIRAKDMLGATLAAGREVHC